MTPRRAVFLDRDGVLVEMVASDRGDVAPLSLETFRIVDDAAATVARLREAGFLLILFTNQPEVARGRLTPDTLAAMHVRLQVVAPLDDILVCPHDDADQCACRKPKPGMLHAAAAKWNVDLRRSFVVGDRWRDIDAGRAAGCTTVLIDRPYSQCSTADARVNDLREVVGVVLERAGRAAHV